MGMKKRFGKGRSPSNDRFLGKFGQGNSWRHFSSAPGNPTVAKLRPQSDSTQLLVNKLRVY